MVDHELPDGFRPGDETAPDRADTEYTEAYFEVKEHPPRARAADADPWIIITPQGQGVRMLREGFLGLEFRSGVTLADATQLASDMRRLLVGVSHTRFLT